MATQQRRTRQLGSFGKSDPDAEDLRDTPEVDEIEHDDWTLNTDQMIFMLQHHNAIENAFNNDDLEFLRSLAETDEFQTLFGDMSFDEAYDRYQCMTEADGADS